ncbi:MULTISPECIES: hypothetical protein [unclassified Streptomyces]|uniref:hypothetical protein n=1 Tax=unclassified Streptomyces TaxID=2593676 RepID=UPI002E2DC891|nr:hypothetical protein [Streptomyces sp. NBC_00208]
MRPESRTESSPVRWSWWPARLAMGGVTSLAAVSLVAALGAVPAQAQGLVREAQPASAAVSTDRGSLWEDPDPYFPWNGKPGKPVRPGGGCFEIDTVRQEGGSGFYAATSGGIVYAGDESGAGGNIDWDDLISDGEGDVPVGACGVSIDIAGNDIFIDVITTSGTVYGIVCNRVGGDEVGTCGDWVQRATPTPGDV